MLVSALEGQVSQGDTNGVVFDCECNQSYASKQGE